MLKGKVCCFTGHREIADAHALRIQPVLESVLDRLILNGVRIFRAGGAMGFDTVAALAVIENKKKNEALRLHLYLPCKDQTQLWDSFSKDVYSYVMRHADEVIYTSERYSRGCMLYRDRRLVDGADICVAYCTKNSGGTVYTLDYAAKSGLRTINIATMI